MASPRAPVSPAVRSITIPRDANQRITTDSALQPIVTLFFTRSPCRGLGVPWTGCRRFGKDPPLRSRCDRFGRIAQLVEQLTLNQRVQGSSPCAPTTHSPRSPFSPEDDRGKNGRSRGILS